jgi:predicted amidohydrolase
MWKIASVQMDCRFGDNNYNLGQVRGKLREAAENGAKLVVFPECILTGYAFASKEEAWPHAEPIPGPSTKVLAEDCRRLGVHVVVGSLEQETRTGDLFNVAILIGPGGVIDVYRKMHLPYLGVDRYTTPGDRHFAVYDIGGLRVGMNICYDGGFPETARCLMLLGADLVVLPTNWPEGARVTVKFLMQARALENRIYYLCCNRVGEEGGFPFIGMSRIIDISGDLLAHTDAAHETILYAEIDPARARNKHIAFVPGSYELHRTAHRRPEMYGLITEPVREKFVPLKPRG